MFDIENLILFANVAAQQEKMEVEPCVGSRKEKQPIHSIRSPDVFPVDRKVLDNLEKPEFLRIESSSALPTNLEKKGVQQNGGTKSNCKLFRGPDINDCINLDSVSNEKVSSAQFNVAEANKKRFEQVAEYSVHDHNYLVHPPKGRKRNKASTVKSRKTDAEKVTLQRLLPQFIIPTPPFPYVHGSSDIQVAAKCEIRQNGEPVNYIREITVDPQIYSSFVISSVLAKKQNLSYKKRIPRLSNKVDVTGSVLECVENRVDIKLCQPSTSKDINLTLDNISENSENLQKTVKRKAEELIKNLTLSKKKGYTEEVSCDICKKSFTTLSSLRSHYRSHAGIKPFKCTVCFKLFTRYQSLKYHLKVHSNENVYVCEYCERGFRHRNHYKEHLRIHTGETPYSCPECEKRFATRNTYKRHLQAIHKKVLTRHGIEDLNPDDTSKV